LFAYLATFSFIARLPIEVRKLGHFDSLARIADTVSWFNINWVLQSIL
jgi:hypothetical protein